MQIKASCDLELHLEIPTPLILMLRPQSGASQWVYREEYTFSDSPGVVEYPDLFGNLCQRLVAPAGVFKVHTVAEVETAETMDACPGAPFMNVQDLPVDVLGYLVPSRYCESDRLGDKARNIAAGANLGYDQVMNITNWIQINLPYAPGTSDIPLSASEVLAQGRGVCRDLAHLGIALCRSISIPTRMVVGYLTDLEPMDLHAWFEAYVGGRWYTFDPSQKQLTGGRIAIAYGRDAADVAIFHQFGPLPTFSDMIVNVERLSN
jgi:transglutaminase-like putative cysteine protease